MNIQIINTKLYLYSYIYCKALNFELNHNTDSFKDRVTYFIGCKFYEVIIHYMLKKHS